MTESHAVTNQLVLLHSCLIWCVMVMGVLVEAFFTLASTNTTGC